MLTRRFYWAVPLILVAMIAGYSLRSLKAQSTLFKSLSPNRCLTTDFEYNAISTSNSQTLATLPSLRLPISITPIRLLDSAASRSAAARFQFADGQSIFVVFDRSNQALRSFMTSQFDASGFPLAIEVAGRFPLGNFDDSGDVPAIMGAFEYNILGHEKIAKDDRGFHADSIKGNLNQTLAFRLLDGFRDVATENGKIKFVKGGYRLVAGNGSKDVWNYGFQYVKTGEKSSPPSDCAYDSLSALVQSASLQEVDYKNLQVKLYNQARRQSFDKAFDAEAKLSEALKLNQHREENHDQVLKLFGELSDYYAAFPERVADLLPIWEAALKERPFNRAKSLFLFDLIDNRDDPSIQEWAMAQFDAPSLKDDPAFREHIIANMNFGEAPSDKVFERLKALLHETPKEDALHSTLLLALASYGARSDDYRAEAMEDVQKSYQEASTPSERNLAIGAAGNLGTKEAKALLMQALSGKDESDQSAAIAALSHVSQPEAALFDYALRSRSSLDLRSDAVQTLCRLDQAHENENSFRASLENYYEQISLIDRQGQLSRVFFDCLRNRGDPLTKADDDRKFVAKIKAKRPLRAWEHV